MRSKTKATAKAPRPVPGRPAAGDAKVVKLTFARGARLPDPSRLFDASLEGGTRRAIDIHEGETVDAGAFEAPVKAAVARNGSPAKKRQALRTEGAER